MPHSVDTLLTQLTDLGVRAGDGLFVHASMRAMGRVENGSPTVVESLLRSVGVKGLLGMPGFTEDAVLTGPPPQTEAERLVREAAVPGYDPQRSPAHGMGAIAETFRTWPGTLRSAHPVEPVCLRGSDADHYIAPHELAWAMGPGSPMERLRARPDMKILLIGVGWNRCSTLHVAETLAETRRTKVHRFLPGVQGSEWIEVPEYADDLSRLFPSVGRDFEQTGAVTIGQLGAAECRLCGYAELVDFATPWINDANLRSGDRD